jgi:ketopantoate reductase
MDRTESYQEIVKRVISQYSTIKPSYGDVEVELVYDDERGHYELVYAGWDGYRRIHGSVVHIDVRDGKVWIQHDGIEEGVTDELLAEGIPPEHIVLAFQHPHKRQFSGFAVQ